MASAAHDSKTASAGRGIARYARSKEGLEGSADGKGSMGSWYTLCALPPDLLPLDLAPERKLGRPANALNRWLVRAIGDGRGRLFPAPRRMRWRGAGARWGAWQGFGR